MSGYIGTAKIGNFKGLAVTKLTDHELRERLLQANPDEPHVDGLIFGEEAIAKAAGYRKARYFAETYLTDVTTRSALGPHVLSQHTPFGHYYQVGSEVLTHLSSGAAFGDNIRGHMRQQLDRRRGRGAGLPAPRQRWAVGSEGRSQVEAQLALGRVGPWIIDLPNR